MTIKEARIRAGMTQAELAERIGRTKSSVQKYEDGQTVIPISVLKLIAETLGVSLAELLDITPRPQWIPVSERLPEKRGCYLGYVINDPWRYAITVTFFPADSFYPGSEPSWCPDSETASDNVVAWMPLPEPYREGGDAT